MPVRLPRFMLLTLAAAIVLTGCTGSSAPDEAPSQGEVSASLPTASPTPSAPPEPPTPQALLQAPDEDTTVLASKDPAAIALAASTALFESAPVVVVAAQEDDDEILRAASAAVALGAPLLLADGDLTGDAAAPGVALREELTRLEAEAALTFGVASDAEDSADASEKPADTEDASDSDGEVDPGTDVIWVPAPADDVQLSELLGIKAEDAVVVDKKKEIKGVLTSPRGSFTPLRRADADDDADVSVEKPTQTTQPGADMTLPETELAEPLTDVLALTTNSSKGLAAVATTTAAGAQLTVIPGGDPRRSATSVAAIADADYAQAIGIGAAFENDETLSWRLKTAATGVELPGGGQLVFPGKRYVALYGTPSTSALGLLGEQDVPATVKRAHKHAKKYQDLSDDTVVPALEIIATVASAGAGADGNYSNELPPESLRPLIDAAHEQGQYVLLDLQPGRASFLEQAKQYKDLLKLPYVGLALDPEWNLGPDEKHLTKIGSVTSKEVNDVVTWLADFTQQRALPQKMLVLHQFQVRMIDTVDDVDLSRSELAVLIHVDGQGGQSAKQSTWKTLHAEAEDIQWWGWKNFYDEDHPMLTPKETAKVKPFPNFISYQ